MKIDCETQRRHIAGSEHTKQMELQAVRNEKKKLTWV